MLSFRQLLQQDVQDFVNDHLMEDVSSLLLRQPKAPAPISDIAQHIAAKQKIKQKLPSWYAHPLVCFPPKISLEQASSEITAALKVDIIRQLKVKPDLLIDLTGGFGADSLYFSKYFTKVHYIEQQKELVEIVQHNFKQLGADNITSHHEDAQKFLSSYTQKVDMVFLDPARRDQYNRSIAQLEDCSPNILDLLPHLRRVTDHILLKAAPMLDIKKAIKELGCVQKVWVVAHLNDCKELLFLLSIDNQIDKDMVPIQTINILSDGSRQIFGSDYKTEGGTQVSFGDPQQYIYEPNVSILKAGFFKEVARQYQLEKLAPNSHIYTSSILVEDFPGRTFELLEKSKASKKVLSKLIPTQKTNIICRNYPLSPAQLLQKIKFKEGGDQYLLATTLHDSTKCVLWVKRLS